MLLTSWIAGPTRERLSMEKAELVLLENRTPFSAERSFLSVVTFINDRHRFSGEQLANVLTAEGILCYCDEGNKV